MQDSSGKVSRRSFIWLGTAAAASLLAACQPMVNRRGYYAKPGALNQVKQGMAKSEVEAIMGSPSTTASVNLQGDSYYYISSTTSQRSFLDPQEQNREVIAIRFDRGDQVTNVAQYGLEDGRVINMLDRKTPVIGQEFSLIQELLSGKGGPVGSVIRNAL